MRASTKDFESTPLDCQTCTGSAAILPDLAYCQSAVETKRPTPAGVGFFDETDGG
jgi:hypothetical protein